jgi:serine/threonine protein phosphatase PrpC
MPLAASGVTHQGRRSTNEDAWLVDLDLGLLVVADGMGGHNAGEVASALAVKVIREVFQSDGSPPSQALLIRAVQVANQRILAEAAEQPAHSGMGTTVVAVLVNDEHAY